VKSYYYILVFSLFLSGYVNGQESQKDSITRLEEVVVVDPVKISKTIGIVPSQVIGESVFQNYSPIDIVRSVNQISGVYILSGALNTNRITIRGVGARTPFGSDKVQLYYNNIPVTDGTGISTIENYDIENLGAIEVVKGPKGTAYGTGLGGAILLRSKSIQESTNFENNFTYGSYNLVKNNLSFKHGDQKFSLGLRYGTTSTDGFRQNNRFERDGVLLDTKYQLSKKSEFGFLLNYVDYLAQIPSTLSATDFAEDPTRAAANWLAAQGFEDNKYSLLGLSHTYTITDDLKNTSSIFYTYLDHFEARPFNILDEFTKGYGFRTRFSGSFGLGQQAAEYTLGSELYKDEYNWGTFANLFRENNGNGSLQGDRLSRNKEFRSRFNAFAALTLPISSVFKVQAGLNFNSTQFDFRDRFNAGALNRSATRNFDPILLPSLNLNYTFPKGGKIYANLSRGFSNPTLEETLTPDGVINPDIEQEKGTNYELGTSLFLAKDKLLISFAVYRMNIQNLLVAERIDEDQFIGRNAGETRHQGIELDINYSWDISAPLKVSPFVSYTVNDHSFIEFVDDTNDFSGNPLTGVPKHQINAGIQFAHRLGFYWNTTYQFIDEIPLTDANTLNSDAFSIFHTKIGYKATLFPKTTLGIDFGINNVFDIRYAQSVLINAIGFGGAEPRFFAPGNDRNVYGSIQLQYQL